MNIEQHVINTILQLSSTESKFNLKEPCGLKNSLTENIDEHSTIAWIELNNNFFFSIDYEVFKKFCNIMNIINIEVV